MKTSLWSTAVTPKSLEKTLFTVSDGGPNRVVTLRRRNPNGTYSRMRIVLSPEEARELAASIAPTSKFIPGLD